MAARRDPDAQVRPPGSIASSDGSSTSRPTPATENRPPRRRPPLPPSRPPAKDRRDARPDRSRPRAHQPHGRARSDEHEHRARFLRHGSLGTRRLAALVLLASFYSVVSGAVDRAARSAGPRRSSKPPRGPAADARFAARPWSPSRAAADGAALRARAVASGRRIDAARSPRGRAPAVIGTKSRRGARSWMSRERDSLVVCEQCGMAHRWRPLAPVAGPLRALRGRPRPRPPPPSETMLALTITAAVVFLIGLGSDVLPRHARRAVAATLPRRSRAWGEGQEAIAVAGRRSPRCRAGALPRPAPLCAGAAGRGPRAARLRLCVRLLHQAARWSMVEVFTIGACCRWCACPAWPTRRRDRACSPSARLTRCSRRSNRPG